MIAIVIVHKDKANELNRQSGASTLAAHNGNETAQSAVYSQPDWQSHFTILTDDAQASAMAAQESSWNAGMLSTSPISDGSQASSTDPDQGQTPSADPGP